MFISFLHTCGRSCHCICVLLIKEKAKRASKTNILKTKQAISQDLSQTIKQI